MTQNRHVRLVCEELECRQLLSGSLDLTGVEWRTIDGADNITAHPAQGAAETRQIRFGYGAQFPDGFGDAIIPIEKTRYGSPGSNKPDRAVPGGWRLFGTDTSCTNLRDTERVGSKIGSRMVRCLDLICFGNQG
jgi:hypothetical protein